MSIDEGAPQKAVVDLPLPTPASAWSAMVAVPRMGRRWPGAARAAAAVALPGLIGIALGFGPVAAVSVLGAFAVVYGESRPYRVRARVVAVVGAVMVGLAVIGTLVGSVVHGALDAGGTALWSMVVVLTMTAVVATCAFVVDALRLGAPGAFLMLLSLEIACVLPSVGVTIAQTAAWATVGAVTALVVAMSGIVARPRTPERTAVAAAVRAVNAVLESDTPAHRRVAVHDIHMAWQCLHDAGLVGTGHSLVRRLLDAHLRCAAVLHGHDLLDGRPHSEAGPEDDLRPRVPLPRPSVRYRLRRAAHVRGRSATIAIRLLVAGPVAGGLAVACGFGRPDWAVITAAMILHQGPDRILGSYRALHRFIGTVLGLVLLAALSSVELGTVGLVVALAATMAGCELFLVRNYSLAMVFITPLAVILGGLGAPGDLEAASKERLLETVVGVCVALAVMWGVLPRAHRGVLADADSRVADSVVELSVATDPEARSELRRDLEFDLHASTTASIIAAHTEPAWTRARWPEHRRLHDLGYRLLTSPK